MLSYPYNRMMNGEELKGLTAEELGKLEAMLKAGQNRVQELKVFPPLSYRIS